MYHCMQHTEYRGEASDSNVMYAKVLLTNLLSTVWRHTTALRAVCESLYQHLPYAWLTFHRSSTPDKLWPTSHARPYLFDRA